METSDIEQSLKSNVDSAKSQFFAEVVKLCQAGTDELLRVAVHDVERAIERHQSLGRIADIFGYHFGASAQQAGQAGQAAQSDVPPAPTAQGPNS